MQKNEIRLIFESNVDKIIKNYFYSFEQFWFTIQILKLLKMLKKNNDLIESFFFKFWWNRIELKISKFANKNSNICFDCIANETKNDKLIIDIFIDSHIDLIASIKKCELITNFFAYCSRLCWQNIFSKLNVCLQCRHANNFFVDFDVISNAKNWKIERFNKMIVSNAIANSFIDFWIANETNDLYETNNVFFDFAY